MVGRSVGGGGNHESLHAAAESRGCRAPWLPLVAADARARRRPFKNSFNPPPPPNAGETMLLTALDGVEGLRGVFVIAPPSYRSPYRTPYRSLNLRLNVSGDRRHLAPRPRRPPPCSAPDASTATCAARSQTTLPRAQRSSRPCAAACASRRTQTSRRRRRRRPRDVRARTCRRCPTPRANRTRRVPHPVLIGHAASLTSY